MLGIDTNHHATLLSETQARVMYLSEMQMHFPQNIWHRRGRVAENGLPFVFHVVGVVSNIPSLSLFDIIKASIIHDYCVKLTRVSGRKSTNTSKAICQAVG